MLEKTKTINRIFLHYLLIAGMVGSVAIFLIDIRQGFGDTVSLLSDAGVFLSVSIGYIITKVFKKDNLSVVFFTSSLLLVMVFLFLNSTGYYFGISSLVIIVLGYSYSLMLKGALRMSMQIITILTMFGLMFYQNAYPERFVDKSHLDLIGTAMPFILIYIIIATTAAILKDKLDAANLEVQETNLDLNDKNREIETQNEELNAQREELNAMNSKLEELVQLRTLRLMEKNELLTHYAFRNAHNVRGPLARILGLLILRKVDSSLTHEMIFEMIEKEAQDMDAIVREIARELVDGES